MKCNLFQTSPVYYFQIEWWRIHECLQSNFLRIVPCVIKSLQLHSRWINPCQQNTITGSVTQTHITETQRQTEAYKTHSSKHNSQWTQLLFHNVTCKQQRINPQPVQHARSNSHCPQSASIKISNRVAVCCSMRWYRRHWSRAELSYVHAIAKSPMASKLFIVFFQRKNTINQRNHKLSSAWAMEFTPRHG